MTTRTEGLERVRRMLDKLDSRETRMDAAEIYANMLQKDVAEYPAGSSANRPGGKYSWYVRGTGVRTRTGITYPVSQDTVNRWKVRRQQNSIEITNDSTYSGYMHIEDRQTWFHRLRGWRTAKRVDRANGDKYVRAALAEIERKLDSV